MRRQGHPRLVVVTGAGSGIGLATATTFAARGDVVICADIDGDAARRAARQCGGASAAFAVDVGDAAAVATLARQVQADHGPVDVLVNNAGVGLGGDFLEATVEDWAWIRAVNLDGVVHGCMAFGPAMVERGRGQVVNIASMAGYTVSRRLAAYCTTKAAVIMLSQCLRADWGRHGIGVTALCPGVIRTPIVDASRIGGSLDAERGWVDRIMARAHPPQLVADAVVRAVKANPPVMAVGLESRLAYHASKVIPARMRTLGGVL